MERCINSRLRPEAFQDRLWVHYFLNAQDSCLNIILKYQRKGRGKKKAFVGCCHDNNGSMITESEDVSEFGEFLREKVLGIGGISQTNAVIHDASQTALVARVHLPKEEASLFCAIDTVCAENRLL